MYILIINVIKEIKDMKKKSNKKGFTIMEMLIVVAIIAVLAAIAIPVFNGALTKSKEAADVANIRAAYAEMTAAYLTDNTAYSEIEFKKALGSADGNGEYNTLLNFGDRVTYTNTKITYAGTKITDKDGDSTFEWNLGTTDIN